MRGEFRYLGGAVRAAHAVCIDPRLRALPEVVCVARVREAGEVGGELLAGPRSEEAPHASSVRT